MDDLSGQISDLRYQLTQLTVALGAGTQDQATDVIKRLINSVRNLQQAVANIQAQQTADEATVAALTARVAALEVWGRTVTPPFPG